MRTFYSDSLIRDTDSFLASQPVSLFECECCGSEIYEGERYYAIGEKRYCGDCISEKTAGQEEE